MGAASSLPRPPCCVSSVSLLRVEDLGEELVGANRALTSWVIVTMTSSSAPYSRPDRGAARAPARRARDHAPSGVLDDRRSCPVYG